MVYPKRAKYQMPDENQDNHQLSSKKHALDVRSIEIFRGRSLMDYANIDVPTLGLLL